MSRPRDEIRFGPVGIVSVAVIGGCFGFMLAARGFLSASLILWPVAFAVLAYRLDRRKAAR